MARLEESLHFDSAEGSQVLEPIEIRESAARRRKRCNRNRPHTYTVRAASSLLRGATSPTVHLSKHRDGEIANYVPEPRGRNSTHERRTSNPCPPRQAMHRAISVFGDAREFRSTTSLNETEIKTQAQRDMSTNIRAPIRCRAASCDQSWDSQFGLQTRPTAIKIPVSSSRGRCSIM